MCQLTHSCEIQHLCQMSNSFEIRVKGYLSNEFIRAKRYVSNHAFVRVKQTVHKSILIKKARGTLDLPEPVMQTMYSATLPIKKSMCQIVHVYV